MKPLTLIWHSIDPDQNRARWYSLTTAIDLWGNSTVIKRWGRIHQQGQMQSELYTDKSSLSRIIMKAHKLRTKHGYVLSNQKSH